MGAKVALAELRSRLTRTLRRRVEGLQRDKQRAEVSPRRPKPYPR